MSGWMIGHRDHDTDVDKTDLLEVFGPELEAGVETSCRNVFAGRSAFGRKTLNKIRP